jgi:2'-5' RNA ligase
MIEERALRLFVACPLPDEIRRALGAIQDEMRRAGFDRLRYVRPEGIHLTLKFLGSVEARRVDAIKQALEGAVEPFELRLQLDQLGGFGGPRIRVVWVGLSGDVDGLTALAARIEDALQPLGFSPEGRPFAPHLTLARVPDQASPVDRRRLARFVGEYAFPSLSPMIASDVQLMQSFPGPGGSKYEQLATFPVINRPEG